MQPGQPGFVGTYFCPECKKFFNTLEELRAHEPACREYFKSRMTGRPHA